MNGLAYLPCVEGCGGQAVRAFVLLEEHRGETGDAVSWASAAVNMLDCEQLHCDRQGEETLILPNTPMHHVVEMKHRIECDVADGEG
ncbi:hypothetical protein [Amycolatopsis anabasis]|uniref:hypothetical protein n=1 Tax=Amycolatopsis anabasis TaxID=1840409 RepID=UPI00131D19CB|nr:hypothetical protein [Amycolatopsis anabasis]